MKRILSSPHRHLTALAEDSISVELATLIEIEEAVMFAYIAQRIASLRNESPEQSLIISTLLVVAVVTGCRSLVKFISHDPAELDGFVFLAGLYWAYSVVGYVATRSKRRRQSLATSHRRTAIKISATRSATARGGV